METSISGGVTVLFLYSVRMKVFPERDGNSKKSGVSNAHTASGPNEGLPWKGWKRQKLCGTILTVVQHVRMKVFPERDGNVCLLISVFWVSGTSPNEGLPWKGWKLHIGFESMHFICLGSEWRSSLKGMETTWRNCLDNLRRSDRPNEGLPWKGWKLEDFQELADLAYHTVRMKVFPERDGNHLFWYLKLCGNFFKSEWRSSLKGMETRLNFLFDELRL